MKKERDYRLQFNITLNQEELDMIHLLKEKYCVNVSGTFKLFLKQYKEKLEKSNVAPHI